MRIGLNIGVMHTQQKPLGEYLIRLAEQADQAGFATLVIPDHFSLRAGSTTLLKRDEQSPKPATTDNIIDKYLSTVSRL